MTKLPTGILEVDILDMTQKDYEMLIATGMEYEIYPSFPNSWGECLKLKEEILNGGNK